MANPEHLAILKKGVEAWNRWRKLHPEILPDLEGAGLAEANLARVDLRYAELRNSDLLYANLTEARLEQASLSNANLFCATLSRAKLTGANFSMANLTGARLAGADLSNASFWATIFGGTSLKDARLDHCRIDGPCVVDFETLAHSWPLPEAFLQGCGLPDSFIDRIPSLISDALYHSCFISYSSGDEPFAKRLHDNLQSKGVRCWFAPHDVQGGKKLHEQIDQAIRIHDRLLLILSEHSMASNWVKTEIANARQREANEGKRVLFPIRLVDFEDIKEWSLFDADTGIDSAREIREYFIRDFSNWTDDGSYKEAFERLLRDLKAG